MAALESLAAGYGCTTWPDAIVRCKEERDDLSARLAACEAGIKDALPYIPSLVPRATLIGLLNLLAPRAGGERK